MKTHWFARIGWRCARGIVMLLVILGIILACTGTGWTQLMSRSRTSISGEVLSQEIRLPDNLTVELYDLQQHRIVDRAPLLPNGRFEFRLVETGPYELRIVDLRGECVRQEFIDIHPNGFPLQIRLPQRSRERSRERLGGGTVSINELRATKQQARSAESRSQSFPARLWARIKQVFQVVIGQD